MHDVITNHLDLWTSSLLTKSSAGRGRNGKQEAYGIKKLRELILELAVRGKLVPQEPNDEPASALLNRIAKEKARLLKTGNVKKERPSLDIRDDEKAFELPQGWEWVRFGSIAQHNSGKTLDRGRNTGQLRDYITTSNLYWGQFDLDNIRQMPIADYELEKCTARKGDLLICEGGEAGRAAVWPFDYDVCFQNHVHRARFYAEIDPYFAYRFFEKLNATGEIDQYRKGVGISNMSSKALASIVVPLPPLAEQHRIVAKVDELMALCDQLEQQQSHSIEAHQTLVEALLGTLTGVTSPQELSEAWARIAAQFDTLITTEHSIDQLKQTILQLAVMGKLVSQDPRDELADVLVQRIQKNNQAKKYKDVVVDDFPFDLPTGWAATKLGSILNPQRGISYGVIKLGAEPEGGGVYILRCSNVRFREIDLTGIRRITEELSAEYGRTILEGGEILINVRGTLGGCAVVPQSMKGFNIAREVAVVPVHEELDSEFLLNVVAAPYFQNKVNESLRGIAYEGLNLGLLREFLVPIPPLAEQHRIVAKVDELMALCEALKVRLADVQTTQIHLADAITERAVV